ncbi:hypothetical protein BCR33DRAFT_746350 [Rhizoclosmatium globosum]|uniref:Uncharacterized protein n=1 Tax=Rhizoclosmatium globosum TaxID=329046 RepID=A0A1Y2AW87_9FUNG|nr:hypothetical protein BCR33DRAFT_746350 [Rhizoclosmatium globosum]|eukprot:ORY26853.1 hypothetical protein BCR33DRAFT_746350 [Rhizoclosmatium globosum]
MNGGWDNNNGGPGPSGGGGNGGGRRRPGPRGNGPRLNALQNRYQKDNDSSMDFEDPQETELQENTTIGDSGAMEHVFPTHESSRFSFNIRDVNKQIVDAGQHSNQVNKMFDAMINIGARRFVLHNVNSCGAVSDNLISLIKLLRSNGGFLLSNRDHIWYSNTFGADAKWDEVFRVVNEYPVTY